MNSEKCNLKVKYPKIVGFYSISDNCEFIEDISQLRYVRDLAKTELPFDLNGRVSRPRKFGHNVFDSLQRFLAENKGFLDGEEGIPFICTQKTLQDLCISGDLNISACFHQGSIFLRAANCGPTYSHAKLRLFNKNARGVKNPHSFPTRKDVGPWAWGLNFKQLTVSGSSAIPRSWEDCQIPWPNQRTNLWTQHHSQKKRSGQNMDRPWGLKFKQFMLSETPGGRPSFKENFSGIEHFTCVFKSTLKDHSIFFAQKVDAFVETENMPFEGLLSKVEIVEKLNELDIVNLHYTLIDPAYKHKFGKRMSLMIWLQAHLVGASKVVTGQCDTDGILKMVEEVTPKELIKLNRYDWNPREVFAQCEKVLSAIKAAFIVHINNLKHLSTLKDLPPTNMFFVRIDDEIQQISPSEANDHPKIYLPKH